MYISTKKIAKKSSFFAFLSLLATVGNPPLFCGGSVSSPSPTIEHVKWKGVNSQDQEVLEEAFHLEKGAEFSVDRKKWLTKAIKDHFRQKGYKNASVTIQVTQNKRQVFLYIHVKKRKKYFLGKVSFNLVGLDQSVNTFELMHQLSYSKAGGSATFAFQIPSFVEEKIAPDIEALRKYCHSKGYLYAKITHHLAYREDKIDITFNIEANGPKCHIEVIEWVGNFFVASKTLNKKLGLRKGQVYNRTHIEQITANNIEERNVHMVYEEAQVPVTPSFVKCIEKKIKDGKVVLQIHVEETIPPEIAYIKVPTKALLREDIIRKILAQHNISPGKKSLHRQLSSCQKALEATHLFHPHTVRLDVIPVAPGKVGIRCRFLEKRSYDFHGELDAISSMIKMVFEERNFDLYKFITRQGMHGGGQSVKGYGGINPVSLCFNGGLSLRNPWFYFKGHPTPLLFECYRSYKYVYEGRPNFKFLLHASQKYTERHLQRYDGKLTFERKNLKNDKSSLSLFYVLCPQISYSSDQTNDHHFPTKGKRYRVELKAPILINNRPSWNKLYLQALGKYEHFYTSTSGLTYVYTAQGGLALNGKYDNPINRFILGYGFLDAGGAKLLNPSMIPFRGYASKDKKQAYAGSGQYAFSQSIEVRLPFLKDPLVYLILFLGSAHTDQDPFLANSGIEIRIKTPICIISFYVYHAYVPQGGGGWGAKIRLNF